MGDEATAQDARQMWVATHGVRRVYGEPAPAALEKLAQRHAFGLADLDLRGVADEKIRRRHVVVIRSSIGVDIAQRIQLLRQANARKVEVVIARWTTAH